MTAPKPVSARSMAVLEGLRAGKTVPEIAEELQVGRQNVWGTISGLKRRGLVKIQGRGEFVIPNVELYVSDKTYSGPRGRPRTKPQVKPKIEPPSRPPEPVEPPKVPEITPEQEHFIRAHYGRMRRREMARELGIGKYELNAMIMQLRLGRQ